MLLVGSAIHNIADGIVIASAFMVNPLVGTITTFGIALHEAPQEIAKFGVLIQSGCSQGKAALYNFISALSIIIGVLVTYLFVSSLNNFLFVLTGVAAGNLLYIATADFIPELRHSHRDHFFKTFLATLLGVIAVVCLVLYTHTLAV
jgi:zinc and cadmium transporter